MAHACFPISIRDFSNLAFAGFYAREMRGSRRVRFLRNSRDRIVRALACRSAGAVGDRDEARRKRLQRLHRFPKRFFHLRGLGREEFKTHCRVPGKIGKEWGIKRAPGLFQLRKGHVHAAITFNRVSDDFTPSHSLTVSDDPASSSLRSN